MNPVDIAASHDQAHPKHNFHFAQILATILMGVEDAAKVTAAPSMLQNPLVLAQFIQGFASIWKTGTPQQ